MSGRDTYPAYLSADGGAAVLLARVDGCEVWAVRRLWRYDPRPTDCRLDAEPQAYWTLVAQTMPGREKSQAWQNSRRHNQLVQAQYLAAELLHLLPLAQPPEAPAVVVEILDPTTRALCARAAEVTA